MANSSYDTNPTAQERELKRLNDQLQSIIYSCPKEKLYSEDELRQRLIQVELRCTSELKQQYQKELEELNAYNSELQGVCEDLRAQLEQSKANKLSNDELNKQVNVLNIKLHELTQQKQSLEKELENANVIYQSAKTELQVYQTELSRLKKKLQDLSGEAESKLREYQQKYEAELKSELEARLEEEKRRAEDIVMERVSKLQEEIDYMNLNYARLQEENRAFKDRNGALEQEKERLEVEVRNTTILQNQLLTLESQNKGYISKIQELEKRNTRDSNNLASLQQQLAAKDNEHHKLLRELQIERDLNEKLNGDLSKLQNESEFYALQKEQMTQLQNQLENMRKLLKTERNNSKSKDLRIEALEREIAELRPTGIAKQVKRYNELIKQIEENPWTINVGTKRRRQTDIFETYHRKGEAVSAPFVLQIAVHENYLELRNVSTDYTIDLTGWKLKSFRASKKTQGTAPDKKYLECPFPSLLLKPNQEIKVWNENSKHLGPNELVLTKDAWDPAGCRLSLTFILKNLFQSRPPVASSAPNIPEFLKKIDTHNYESEGDTDRASGGEDCLIM